MIIRKTNKELNPEKLRRKSQQAAPEKQNCGNGRAKMWQWKSRKVKVKRAEKCLEELSLAKWQWKSRKVAIED